MKKLQTKESGALWLAGNEHKGLHACWMADWNPVCIHANLMGVILDRTTN